MYDVASNYLDNLPERETREDEYENPWDELLRTKSFEAVAAVTFDSERDWQVDEILGYVFSLSYCSPKTFGDDKEAFEQAVRERLGELGEGPFRQMEEVEVIAERGRRRPFGNCG